MQNEIERLTNLVERATEDITGCDISTEGFSPELAPLAKAIGECLSNAREMYNFESAIADGDLSVPVPSRHNYFAGPEKDLYYKLKHLTWQAEEVAKGDYSQRVDFMGAFSNAFNFMITELEKRGKADSGPCGRKSTHGRVTERTPAEGNGNSDDPLPVLPQLRQKFY